MKKWILAVLMGLFLAACANEDAKSSSTDSAFKPYSEADRIELKSVLGQTAVLQRTKNGFKLADSDKILMLDIFGTYCAPCQKEAPHLMDYQLKNSDDFMLIGLIHFEKISDEQIVEKFAKKYNAYYFIANSEENPRLVEQILRDIDYKPALSIPFKVVLKNGEYQVLTDTLGSKTDNKFYLGEVSADIIAKDVAKIKSH